MNDNDNVELNEAGDTTAASETRSSRRLHPAAIAGIILGAVLLVVLVVWLVGSGDSGRPVPAPRSGSVDEQSSGTTTSRTLTLSPEQLQNAGITIETVGEQLSVASETTSATGVVEANAYRQTPAVALLGGIVRRVIPELGE
ncbi:MAG TPA: hypothetical protein VFZ23_00310, partial [Pyrinomonadaceae bacterium]